MIFLNSDNQVSHYTSQVGGQALRDAYNLVFMIRTNAPAVRFPMEAGGMVLRQQAFDDGMRFMLTMDFHANARNPVITEAIETFTAFLPTHRRTVVEVPLRVSFHDLQMHEITGLIRNPAFQVFNNDCSLFFSWRVTEQ